MEKDGEANRPLQDGLLKIRFDDALRDHLGEFGRITRRVVGLMCFEEMFCTFHTLVPVFLATLPVFWCSPPGGETLGNCTRSQLDNITVPWAESEGTFKPDHCLMYERNYTSSSFSSEGCSASGRGFNNVTIDTCRSWEFDKSESGESMVVEWNLICHRAWMASTVAAVFLAGRGIGNVIFGWLADRYGRKKVILGAGVANLVAGAACAASPSYVFFLVMRFFHGALVTGKSNTGFVCASEFSGPSWRVFSSSMYMLTWAVSYMLLSGIAYLLRFHSWRILLMALLVPETIYYPLVYFYVPESPRWLFMRERNEEANQVLKQIAQINDKELPEGLQVFEKKDVSSRTPWDLIRTPRIRLITIILSYIWAAIAFVYYGLAMNTSNLGGNIYINFLISGAVEFPAYALVIVVFNRWGRIWPFSMSLILGGVAMLLIAALPTGFYLVMVTSAMIGKFFVSASFSIIWIYTTEVYPTCIRNLGLTLTAVSARLSSPISPYIVLLGEAHKALPYVIFGVLSLFAGLLVLLLPETKDIPMPQTIQDGEDLMRDNGINLKCWKKKWKLSSPLAANGNEKSLELKFENNS